MLPARDKRSIIAAMTFSVVIHIVLFLCLNLNPSRPPADEAFAVMLVEPPRATLRAKEQQATPAPKQIVSPSQAPETPPPLDTTRMSERDSSTEKEQIKRGNPAAGPIKEATTKSVSTPTPPPPQTKSESPKSQSPKSSPPKAPRAATEPSLRLGGGEILAKLGTGTREKGDGTQDPAAAQPTVKRLSDLEADSTGEKQSNASPMKRLENYTPFGRSSLKNFFTGPTGTSDYLPELPDGDITLLNAKANTYAVFVRRVALQVFGALRSQSWASLPYGEIQKLRDFSIIEAVMDRTGKLERIRIQDPSGSVVFDQVVETAARKGTFDQNPPPGAALEDGKFYFAFHARTWARPAVDARGEQRWLLLGTELK